MKRLRNAVLLFVSFALTAPAQVTRPQLGAIVDRNQNLRAVNGVPASTTLGDPLVGGILSAACSADLCLAKAEGALWSQTSNSAGIDTKVTTAPPGPAIFAFSGAGAYVYFPANQSLFWWQDAELQALPFSLKGDVLSFLATGDGLDYAVRRDGAVWREHVSQNSTPQVINWIDSTENVGPLALLPNGILIADAQTVRYLRADGAVTNLAIAGVQSFSPMGAGFVQTLTTDAIWAIRTDTGTPSAFLLPAANETPATRTAPPRPVRRPALKSPSAPQPGTAIP